jgi:hypothetical protein
MKQIRIELILPLEGIYDKTTAYEKYMEIQESLQEYVKQSFPKIVFDTFCIEDSENYLYDLRKDLK